MAKKYSEEQISYVRNLVQREEQPLKVTPATKLMCKEFELKYNESVGRAFRRIMQKEGITDNVTKIEDTKEFKTAAKKTFDKRKKRFIITWAQIDTKMHEEFIDNIEAYAKEIKANIHIIAGRYKNPNSLDSSRSVKIREKIFKNYRWPKRILKHLDANRHNIHPLVQILSDVKIQPTASTPLSGMNGITGQETCIIGHPRMHLKSLPVLRDYPNKLLVTTGACTFENYTDTKVGKKGDFHHQLGFVIVELDGEDFHLRQVTASRDGSFYDLIYHVKDGKVKKNKAGVEAMVLGDIHNLHTDPEAMKVSEQMMDLFQPNHTMIHDLFDGDRINPHARKKDPFAVLEQEKSGINLQLEIDSMLEWLHKYKHHNLKVVRSNHDIFFDRFLEEDWRKLSDKALSLEFANVRAKGLAPNGIIPYIIDQEFNGEVIALGDDDSYNVLGWELGVHGHIGAHGSKGSANQYKNLNVKTVTGHTHVPTRIDGHMSVGTLTYKKLNYTKGMSAWMHSNVVIYPNGKAQHLHIIKGKFTTFKL